MAFQLQWIFRNIFMFWFTHSIVTVFISYSLWPWFDQFRTPCHVFCQLCLRMGQVYPKKKAKTLKLYRRTTCDKKISLTTIWLVKKIPKIHHMFIDRCVEFTMCAHDSRRVRLMVLDSSVLSLTSLGFC